MKKHETLMKKLKFIFAVLIVSTITLNCSNDELYFTEEVGEEIEASSLTKLSKETILIDSLGQILEAEETEEMKALKELLKNRVQLRSYSGDTDYDEYFQDNLYQIKDLAITIKSRAYNGGKQYLKVNGVNNELSLDSYNNSDRSNSQIFRIKRFPAITGIGNVIYGTSGRTYYPISVGYYDSNPNNDILFMKNNENITPFADWDIQPVSTPGYVQIINSGLIAQGSSGSPWDIYYKVMQVGSNNKITFGKYSSGNAAQEFEIEVQTNFNIESLEFVNEHTATITRIADATLTDRDTNRDNSDKSFDISLDRMGGASSSFQQKKNIIFPLANAKEFKTKRPEIINGKVFLQPSISSPACLTYSGSSYTENTGRPDKVRVTLPARTAVTYTFSIPAYRVSCDYKAIATIGVGTTKVTLSGRWTGVIYAEEEGKISYVTTPLDSGGGDIELRTAPITKTIYLKDVDKNNPIKF